MALAGNITEFGLADIFQIVSLQQKTGVLIVESSQGKVTVLLEKGLIVGADASFRPIEERLEQSLVQSQQLSKFQLKRATEKQKKTHQPLWTALAEVGEIDISTLQKALSQQIHETVYQLLRWTEGDYRFEPRKSVEYDHQLVSPVNTEFLVMEGFRITDEWSQFEKEIPSLHIVIRRNPQISTPPNDLPSAEAKVFGLLDTERTIQDVIDMSQLGEFDTCQTVYELMKKQLVERVPGKKGKRAQAPRFSIDVKDLLSKAAVYAVGIGIVVGILFLLNVLPESIRPIHIPNFAAIGAVKPFTSQSRLATLSHYVSIYVLEHAAPPASLEELVQQQRIPSNDLLVDFWGHPYLLTSTGRVIELRSSGQDGTPHTEDDLSIEIPF